MEYYLGAIIQHNTAHITFSDCVVAFHVDCDFGILEKIYDMTAISVVNRGIVEGEGLGVGIVGYALGAAGDVGTAHVDVDGAVDDSV